MKKKIITAVTFILLIIILCLTLFAPVKEKYLIFKYDLTHDNNSILEESLIKETLNTYPKAPLKKLDNNYLNWTKSNETRYTKILNKSQYRIIKRDDFFKKLVGDFRVMDFVCKDSIYNQCIFDADKEFYWLIDEKLPIAVLKLQNALREKGYNPNGFKITYGHRHPKKNEEVRGASSSKHILGQAIDMVIGDINGDGRYTDTDKEIVLEIADKEVIGNNGGIGRYPGSRVVHIDVRGTRARWDSF